MFFSTTNYLCNEWLDESYKKDMEWMKEHNPRRYQVAGLGDWGIESGQIFENWEEKVFDIRRFKQDDTGRYEFMYGLDFGFAADPTAFIALCVDRKNRMIYAFDEFYEYALDNTGIYNMLVKKGYHKEVIMADQDVRTIHELKLLGIRRLRPAKKGYKSIEAGIRRLQDYTLVIHPNCMNLVSELSNYVWKTKDDVELSQPIDEWNHLIDAMRYATEDLDKARFEFM